MDNNEKQLKKLINFADDAGLAIFDELTAVNESLEEFNEAFSKVDLSGLEVLEGEKGEKGDPGKDGKDGKDGPQGPAGPQGKEGYDGFDGIDGKPGKDGAPGRDGKDGSPDSPRDIKLKLESLEGDSRLDASAIKNLPKMVGKLAKDGYPYGLPQPAGALTYKLNGAQVGRGNILNITGSGITATPLDDGITYNIPAGGGGGSPAGLDSWVQYNNAGAFGADVNFLRDPGGSYFSVRSQLAPTVAAQYLQDTNIFGIGIDGIMNTYSDDNFATYFLGTLAGDFTAVGGSTNAMIVGYQSIAGGGISNTNYQYDDALDVADIRVEASTTGTQSRINLTAGLAPGTEGLSFDFGGSNRYSFPTTQPTVGTVLGYASANTLDWVAAPTASLTIGDPISGGTANRILFEDASNNLAESGDLQFTAATGELIVSSGGSNHLYINPAAGQYYLGDGGGTANTTLIEILDSIPQIRNWVNGSFLVQQINAGPRLIDGDTTTFNLYMGDVGNNANGTRIEIADSVKTMLLIAHTSGGSGGLIKIGDAVSDGNDTMMQFDDFSSQVFVQTNGDFGVQNVAGQRAVDVNFAGGTDFLFTAGDVNNIINGTKVAITDSASEIRFTNDGNTIFQNTTAEIYFFMNENTVVLGRNSSGNNTNFSIDDTGENMLGNLDGVFRLQTTAGTTKFLVDLTNSLVTIASVPTHADDAAAALAGLTTGQIYKTTTGGSTFLKIVP